MASSAQHLRIFACAIANDSAGAFMGGSSNGSGLYQSDDTGKTWKHLGWDNIKCYSMDMVQSSNGRILYEATGLGILRSTDYGEHWKQLTDWRISEAMDVAVNQKNPKEIYIATAHGPWRTEDGGKTWELLMKGLPNPYCSGIVIDSIVPNHVILNARNGLLSLRGNLVWNKIPILQNGSKKPYQLRGIKCIRQASPESWGYAYNDTYAVSSDDSGRSFLCDSINPIWQPFLTNSTAFVGVYYDYVTDPYFNDYNGPPREQGHIVIFSTLDNGIQRFKRAEEPEAKVRLDGHSLPHRQIWTLKSFLVTP
ncbi:MAG TPA: sialidase family protein [Candidatus Kapabacteria bacterium]|nr:sialidase family protein [Candidatus Kapabacteria bacterium]